MGAGGLLTMTAIETISVVGRHLGAPLLGALEVIRAAILLAACAAMVIATLADAHASVHLVLDRVPPRARHGLERFSALLSALFFAGLLTGSLWLASDFWSAHEESELLGIPFRPLRVLVSLSAGAIALLFLDRVLRSRPR
jgi:TRAP-type C4-dicarboxylate transport system permease small subunit